MIIYTRRLEIAARHCGCVFAVLYSVVNPDSGFSAGHVLPPNAASNAAGKTSVTSPSIRNETAGS
jgi:hypothetical protein